MNEWFENMEKVRFRWLTTYLDMFYCGDNYMPEEMGFIFWSLGKPDYQLPYCDRGYFLNYKGERVKRV